MPKQKRAVVLTTRFAQPPFFYFSSKGINTLNSLINTHRFSYKPEEGQNPYIGIMSFQHFRGERMYSDIVVKEEANRTETEREEDSMLKDQNFWEEQKGSNTQQNNDDDGGLSPLVLVLIIVGGVVVLAGAAVAVILILKKKNKPVALDDVASEEAVEVIDEQAEEKTEE